MSIIITPPPATGGGVLILISSQIASASSSIDFTSISASSYRSYVLKIENVVPTTTSANLLLRFSNSGTFANSSYRWQNWRITTSGSGVAGEAGTGSGISLSAAGVDQMSNSAADGGSWTVNIDNAAQASFYHKVNYQGYYLGSTYLSITGAGISPTTTAIDGFRLLMDNGTIATGTFNLYGLK